MTEGRGRSRALEGGPGALHALALLVHLSVVASYNGLHAQCPDGSPPPCRAAVARTLAPNSVAVLYFDNLSRDSADAYLADGMTEEIIVQLGRVGRLLVKSQAAVRRYRGEPDPLAVGRTLRVMHLVSGSLRRAGSRLRVNVELTRVQSGDRVWGELYDRDAADLLAIQQDIAQTVATAITGRLLPAERRSLVARPTASPEAYDRFLHGNYFLAQRTVRSFGRAIEEYEAAVRLDPRFTAALARIAYAHALSMYWGWDVRGVPPESVLARGLAAADRALRLDSMSSDVWMARGYLLTSLHVRTYEGVDAAFARAIALDSANAEAYHQYAGILTELGRDSSAAVACHHALQLEPDRPITLVELADLSYLTRRFAEARRWLDSALAVDPSFQFAYAFRAAARLHLGDTAGARGDAETAARLSAGLSIPAEALLVLTAVRAGDTTAALTRLDRLLNVNVAERPNRPSQPAYWLSAALVGVGKTERAFEILNRLQPRGVRLWYYLRYPEFDSVRSDPRFQRLVEESRPR